MRFLAFYVLFFFFTLTIFAQEDAGYEQLQQKSFKLIFQDKAKAKRIIDSLISTHQSKSSYFKGRNYSNRGVYYAVYNNLDSAIVSFEQAVQLIDETEDFYPKALNNLATVYKKNGEYKKALEILYEGLALAEQSNNLNALGKILGEMSSVFKGVNDYDKAVDFALKSINVLEKSENQGTLNLIPFQKQKLANLYRFTGEQTFAIELYKDIYPSFAESDFIDAKISTQVNYSLALIASNQLDLASSILKEVEEEFQTYENNELEAFYHYAMANYHMKRGSIDLTIRSFDTALTYCDKSMTSNSFAIINAYIEFLNRNERYKKALSFNTYSESISTAEVGKLDLISYYSGLAESATQLNLYKLKADYLELVIRYRNEIKDIENFIIAKELQAKYQNEIISQKNKILEQENLLRASNNKLLVLLMVLIILMTFVLIYRYMLKLKAAKETSQLLAAKVEAEHKLLEFKDALLDSQKKELLSNTFGAVAEGQTSLKQSEVDKDVLSPHHPIKKLTHDFERFYPDFKTDLKKTFSNLTKKDLEFLSFIKMNFSYKEIARLINISYPSVITKKYRICKKMQLDSSIDLSEYIGKEKYKI